MCGPALPRPWSPWPRLCSINQLDMHSFCCPCSHLAPWVWGESVLINLKGQNLLDGCHDWLRGYQHGLHEFLHRFLASHSATDRYLRSWFCPACWINWSGIGQTGEEFQLLLVSDKIGNKGLKRRSPWWLLLNLICNPIMSFVPILGNTNYRSSPIMFISTGPSKCFSCKKKPI